MPGSPTLRERVERRLRNAPRDDDLDALACHYGTDKGSQGFLPHNYATIYQRHFAPHRLQVGAVLEIGVGGTSSIEGYETTAGGQSLRMWKRYFPSAQIVGIDVHPKEVAEPRIQFEHGNATDPDFVARVIAAHGPFDIVVDDGSHIGREVIAAFRMLWEAVKPGGFYVVEDLALSYHPDWEGGPPGTPDTPVELIKQLVDDTLLRAGDPFRPTVAEMHLYSEIVFLRRAW